MDCNPAPGRPDLERAIEALRIALIISVRNVPRKFGQPRANTKRARVLALLRRPEGATVAQVAEATGWAVHTVRGFLAGLNKAGTSATVLERVRQVGGRAGGRQGRQPDPVRRRRP